MANEFSEHDFSAWLQKTKGDLASMKEDQLYLVLRLVLHALREKVTKSAGTIGSRISGLANEILNELGQIGL